MVKEVEQLFFGVDEYKVFLKLGFKYVIFIEYYEIFVDELVVFYGFLKLK